jgi:aminobenzoyl-glutamate utilization protein B
VEAMTLIDLLLKPELITQAWEYFRNEQGMKQEYIPMVTKEDIPAIYLNQDIMEEYRPKLKAFYFDETKYDNYLQQLGRLIQKMLLTFWIEVLIS